MILDGALMLSGSATTGQAITTTNAVSTNSIDLSVGRDIGGGHDLDLVVQCLTAFTSGTASATLTVQLQGAPDNGGVAGTFQTLDAGPATPLGQLVAGARPYKQSLAMITEFVLPSITSTLTTTATSTSSTVASATGLLAGMLVENANVVPGTRIASISGTTITLDTAAAVSATTAAVTFSSKMPKPRFLQLNYSVSATMTAGSVFAGLVLDVPKPSLYVPGFVWPASA
jgi:hypothetical protein